MMIRRQDRAAATPFDKPPAPRYALVTGASSGIGLEMARELAKRGYSLLMVSDRGPELEAAASDLASVYEIEASPLVIDLARPEAAQELHHEVTLRSLQIDVLVSNAGFLMYGNVVNIDPHHALRMMQLHMVTPALLAHYFGRDMRARRAGHMLFASSMSAWRSTPGIAHYCSSKRFLLDFAKALRAEMKTSGVKVTCLAPGAVATALYDGMNVPTNTAIRLGIMKHPAIVARKAVKGMLRGKAIIVPCLSAKLMMFGAKLAPNWILRRTHERNLRPGRAKD